MMKSNLKKKQKELWIYFKFMVNLKESNKKSKIPLQKIQIKKIENSRYIF